MHDKVTVLALGLLWKCHQTIQSDVTILHTLSVRIAGTEDLARSCSAQWAREPANPGPARGRRLARQEHHGPSPSLPIHSLAPYCTVGDISEHYKINCPIRDWWHRFDCRWQSGEVPVGQHCSFSVFAGILRPAMPHLTSTFLLLLLLLLPRSSSFLCKPPMFVMTCLEKGEEIERERLGKHLAMFQIRASRKEQV